MNDAHRRHGVSSRQIHPAPWKVLLPFGESGILAAGLDSPALENLRATWGPVHCGPPDAPLPESARAEGFGGAVIGCAPAHREALRAVLDRLRPGGVTIWLPQGGAPPSPRAIRAAGFEAPRHYAFLPARSGKVLLPLSEPRRTRVGLLLYVPGGRLKRFGARWLYRCPRLAQIVCGRTAAVARKPGPIGSTLSLAGWLGARLGREVAEVAVYASREKLTLQLQAADRRAFAVAKVADTPAAAQAVRREADTLRRLGRETGLREWLPAVLLDDIFGVPSGRGLVVTAQEWVGGASFRCSARLTDAHVAFLTALTRVGAKDILVSRWAGLAELERRIEERASAGEDGAAAQDILRDVLRDLERARFRAHRIHGDFAPWNVRAVPGVAGSFRVVDWEASEAEGLPFYDAVFFAARVARLLRGERTSLMDFARDPIAALRIAEPVARIESALRQAGAPALTAAERTALLRLSLLKEWAASAGAEPHGGEDPP